MPLLVCFGSREPILKMETNQRKQGHQYLFLFLSLVASLAGTKDLLIERYVVDMKKKHNLTVKQAKYLLSVIFIAIVFKVIVSKDIEYSDSKIQHINGIEFIKNKIVIKRNIYNINIDFSPEIMMNQKVMSDNWVKFLDSLRKKKKYTR